MIAVTWLGESAFAVEAQGIRFAVDPRRIPAEPVDLVLCTSAARLDASAVKPLLEAAGHAKVVLPKSAAEQALALEIPYDRMTTIDAGLRVEFFNRGLYGRVYAVPSSLEYTPLGGYPKLGYLVRFGGTTIYFPGLCEAYPELADRLRPYSVTVAVASASFTPAQAADLAARIEAPWLAAPADHSGFVEHMLGHRPLQRFTVLEAGEVWSVPEA